MWLCSMFNNGLGWILFGNLDGWIPSCLLWHGSFYCGRSTPIAHFTSPGLKRKRVFAAYLPSNGLF